jgi:hypothetical protein
MPSSIRFPTPIRVDKLTRVMQIRGTDVFVHWTVLVVLAIMLAGTLRNPLTTLAGVASYLGVFLLHEAGHMIAAQRKHCEVFAIELYPILGLVRFEIPWSRFDHCVIAWGGVLAQAIVGIPIIAWIVFFGYTRFEVVNVVLAIFGPLSMAMAAFNLIPAGRLDGATAWGLMPEFLKRLKNRHTKPPSNLGSW